MQGPGQVTGWLRLGCPSCGMLVLVIRGCRRRSLRGDEYHADPRSVLHCDGVPLKDADPEPCSASTRRRPSGRSTLIRDGYYRDALTGIKFVVIIAGSGVITCDGRAVFTAA